MRRILIMTFLIFLVYTGISQDNKKNSISLGFGSVVSTKMDSFSPVIDLSYRRNLTDKLGLNVGYKIKDCSYDKECFDYTLDVYGNNYFYTERPNLLTYSLTVGVSYNLKLYENLYLVPKFDVGLGFSKLTNTRTYSKDGSTSTSLLGGGLTSSIIPSVNIEYNFVKFKIFCSYTYEMLFKTEIIDDFYITIIDVEWLSILTTDYYFLGDFKLGVALKF